MHYHQHRSGKAVWSQRIALWCLLLFIVPFVLHRFGAIIAPFVGKLLRGNENAASFLIMGTPLAVKLLAVASAGAALALLLGLIAMVNIWREGYLGAGRAFVGILVSSLMLAAPAAIAPKFMRLPSIHEVSTDTQSPPAFTKLANARQGDANPLAYQAAEAAEQARAYPDIQPLPVSRSAEQTFDTVREVVHGLNWNIVREQPPENGRAGIIEAVDRTLIFGFTDDVVIRVAGTAKDARVDMRSSARYGSHDLGRSAERVRLLLGQVRTRIAQIDKTERIEKVMKRREEQAQKASGKCTGRKKRAGLCDGEDVTNAVDRTDSIEPQEEVAAAPAATAEPAPPPQEAPGEPKPTKKQRRTEPAPSVRRLWEQLSR